MRCNMSKRIEKVGSIVAAVLCLACVTDPAAAALFDNVTVVIGDSATEGDRHSAELLTKQLNETSNVRTSILADAPTPDPPENVLVVYLGVPERHSRLAELCQSRRVKPLDTLDPGHEGFHLESWTEDGCTDVLAVGVDQSGVLYAAGELLRRQIIYHEDCIELPTKVRIRTAPAFRLRGSEIQQGGTMREMTGARGWTQVDQRRVFEDLALAGANALPGDYDYVKSLGMLTMMGGNPSGGMGVEEWRATEPIGRVNITCPSHPEARKQILKNWRDSVKNLPDYDYCRFHSADPGSCLCWRCDPYGKTYIHILEEMSKILLEYNPDIKIIATNQELCNAGDQAILDYLNEKPQDWFYGICYGPGSNAMAWTSARRPEHRMDLFEYPGFGSLDGYLRYIHHQLPPQQHIVMFTDVTHWVRSQYGLVMNHCPPDRNGHVAPHWTYPEYHMHPDPALFRFYNRRTFFARPKHYRRVFRETMRYGEGDVVYSEGHHDHFNRWMWMRLLWSPHAELDDLVIEYCRFYFGPEAAPLMAQALYQSETNLQAPLATNDGIDHYYLLVREAGWKIPEWRMENDYLWRMHMQKACLDKYIQLRMRGQLDRQKKIEKWCVRALASDGLEDAIEKSLALLEEDIETVEMKRLLAEAGRLGEESDRIFGVRQICYFNTDIDLIGLGWTERQLKRAKAADPDKARDLIHLIAHYDDPGEGGFYDNLGEWEEGLDPNLVNGWKYSPRHSPLGLANTNRLCQNSMAGTAEEERGVALEYHGLDPNAQYRARFTLVRALHLPRFDGLQPQTAQSIYADDILLAKDFELPEREADQFEFDVPREATRDGSLTIQFQKSEGVGELDRPEREVWKNTGGWGTLCSEAWLIKM
ncbi:MAG: DUF4838 domain-containing protein [bacterium]